MKFRWCWTGVFILGLLPLTSARLPCRLEWLPTTAGNSPPANGVEVQGYWETRSEYIARAVMDDEARYVGRFDPDDGAAYFPYEGDNGTATSVFDFDILVNPYNCKVSWTTGNPDFRVLIEEGHSDFIGRVQYNYTGWYGGQITQSEIAVGIDSNTPVYRTNLEYQYLTSFSEGLDLFLTDFVFASNVSAGEDNYQTLDEYINESEASLTQEVSHVKSIHEKTVMVWEYTYTHTTTKSCGWAIFGFGSSKSETHTYTFKNTTRITTETITNLTVTSKVVIPPHTRMRVCSVLRMQEDWTSNYVAVGHYTAASLTGDEVWDIVKDLPLTGVNVGKNEVTFHMPGSLKASLMLNADFNSVIMADDDECIRAQQRIRKRSQHLWKSRNP